MFVTYTQNYASECHNSSTSRLSVLSHSDGAVVRDVTKLMMLLLVLPGCLMCGLSICCGFLRMLFTTNDCLRLCVWFGALCFSFRTARHDGHKLYTNNMQLLITCAHPARPTRAAELLLLAHKTNIKSAFHDFNNHITSAARAVCLHAASAPPHRAAPI